MISFGTFVIFFGVTVGLVAALLGLYSILNDRKTRKKRLEALVKSESSSAQDRILAALGDLTVRDYARDAEAREAIKRNLWRINPPQREQQGESAPEESGTTLSESSTPPAPFRSPNNFDPFTEAVAGQVAEKEGETERSRMAQAQRAFGNDIPVVPRSPMFEGRFGRMFPHLPSFRVDDEGDLLELAKSMIQLDEPIENPNIPAGFTHLGQFIGHDIAFDPNSSLQRINDPEALVNFRTPRFDLDSLYGRGPVDTPFLYDQADPDGVKLLVGRVINDEGQREEHQHDLPRNDPDPAQQRALIGDPRNDENTILSQLHLLFIKFHNKVVDKVRSEQPQLRGDNLLREAQRIVRWHYQWVVVFDFLKRTIPEEMLDSMLLRDDGRHKVKLKFYDWKKQPFMPVEFSAAAYHFVNSQVQARYKINTTVPVLPTFLPSSQLPPKSDPFALRTADLRGFRGLPPFWTVSWPFFFELDGGHEVLQPSLKIDTKVVDLLGSGSRSAMSLSALILLKGNAFELPSGQSVAQAMGVPIHSLLTGDHLGLDGDLKAKFSTDTPLWYYVLKEAEVQQNGERLGHVGGRIVAEVILGLLAGDPLSFLNSNWTPELPAEQPGDFTMADLIRFADPEAANVHNGLPHTPQEQSDVQS